MFVNDISHKNDTIDMNAGLQDFILGADKCSLLPVYFLNSILSHSHRHVSLPLGLCLKFLS